jgi:hypothetical protein
LQRVLPERKGCVVQVDHKASEDLAKRLGWTEDSLGTPATTVSVRWCDC